MIILGEDGLRSQYVPPKPTVKILKRPTRDSRGGGDGPLNDDKPKQPIKSLKQVRNIVSFKLSLILLNTQEYKKNYFRESRNMQKREKGFWERKRVRKKK